MVVEEAITITTTMIQTEDASEREATGMQGMATTQTNPKLQRQHQTKTSTTISYLWNLIVMKQS